jgi:hypothetical protein
MKTDKELAVEVTIAFLNSHSTHMMPTSQNIAGGLKSSEVCQAIKQFYDVISKLDKPKDNRKEDEI